MPEAARQSALGETLRGREVIALDFALGLMLRRRSFRFFRKTLAVCADMESLPLSDAAVELVMQHGAASVG